MKKLKSLSNGVLRMFICDVCVYVCDVFFDVVVVRVVIEFKFFF